ncbi:hypothetical protein C826_02136 [Helicobacter bilis WiWa]|uniref:Uncharacterized protein n=1 Tax=Helicobacter bilis WiWa TaxID=1235804 RepID=N2BKC7_9HELI|nr:hypothetical protein C826_02136 [Helicobacter bilis WiWa]
MCHILRGGGGNIYRYFDRNTRFAYTVLEYDPGKLNSILNSFIAVADTPNRDYVEVTIYHKVSGKKQDTITTYFGINPFLNAKRNITMF